MGYVLLLGQTAQWAEAAAAYDHYMDLTHANNGRAVQEGLPPAARYTDRAGLLAAANFGVGAFGPCYEESPREYQAAHDEAGADGASWPRHLATTGRKCETCPA